MNLLNIWSGNDYAYCQYYKKRGEKFHSKSTRVRAVRTYKRTLPGNEKATGFVECLLVDEDGEITTQQTRELMAHHILCTWEEHLDEMERRRIATAKREQEYKELREKQERERAARLEVEERERNAFFSKLDSAGIPRDSVRLHGEYVYIKKDLLVEVLDELRENAAQTGNGKSITSEYPERSTF